MYLIRERRIKEEDEERKGLDQIYKEKIKKAEQEKLVQLEVATKLEEEEEERRHKEEEEKRLEELEESQEIGKIIQSEEEKDEGKEGDKKED